MLVQPQILTLSKDFITEGGEVLSKAKVAYEEYGNPNGEVILIAHGGLSSQHAAGVYHEKDLIAGFWDDIIGEGKAIDTKRFRVLSSNALGSMYGTCSSLSINPKTNQAYKADFPKITITDMVHFQKAFLDELGVKKLFLMAGPSMGALHSLNMAALYPDFVGAIASVATAGRMPPSGMCMHHFMMNAIKEDPEYNNGNYDSRKSLLALRIIHQASKLYYTSEKMIKELVWDTIQDDENSQNLRSQAANFYLLNGLDEQISDKDPNCYLTILSAINTHDLSKGAPNYEEGVLRIKCPTLLMNISSDLEFPPYWAQEVADILNKKRRNQAKAFTIESSWGHLGCLKEGKKIAWQLKSFIKELDGK